MSDSSDTRLQRGTVDLRNNQSAVPNSELVTTEIPEPSKPPGPIAKVLGAAGIFGALTALEHRGLDASIPIAVRYTERSHELQLLAFRIVEDGRVNDDGVQELVRAAGMHRRDLKRAAASIRQDGYTDEDFACWQANALLVAAGRGESLRHPTEAQSKLFREVEELSNAPLSEAFIWLASREPALREIVQQARQEATSSAFQVMDQEGQEDAIRDILYSERLKSILDQAVDALVRTQRSWYVIRDYLFAEAGLPDPSEQADG